MNPTVKAIALLVRDLMGYDEQLIRVGRQNFERDDFLRAFVVVDELGQGTRVGNTETYDGDAEELSLGAMWKGPVTLDFYGTGAYTRAIEFSLRAKSQTACDLKRALGINAYHTGGPTDLKALTGQQYGERVQIEMVVEVSSEIVIDTLRIDTAQIQIRTEEGIANG
jgi:hypothetical protein